MSDKELDEQYEEHVFSKIEAPKIKHYIQSVQLNVHHFYLFGEIEDSISKYSDLLNILRTSPEEDTIIIYINSEGGSLRMAIQIANAMLASKAKIITSLDGNAFSAATMIFLAGEEYVINPNCSFMIHNYSGGFVGKGHEIRTRVKHLNAYVEKIMKRFYEKILTDEEITSVIDGKDIWMDSDELISRLENGEKDRVLDPNKTVPFSHQELDVKSVEKTPKKKTRKKA